MNKRVSIFVILDILHFIAYSNWLGQFHISLTREYLIPFRFGLWRQEHNALCFIAAAPTKECRISTSTGEPISLKFDLERRLLCVGI
jgi:hypothetical protein